MAFLGVVCDVELCGVVMRGELGRCSHEQQIEAGDCAHAMRRNHTFFA